MKQTEPKPDLRKHELDALVERELSADGMTWFVLEVDAQHELRARYDLRQRGWDAFCMVRTGWVKPHRYAKRKIEKPFPKVPRYVFIGFPAESAVPWYEVCAVDHVRGPLGNHGRPSQVRPADVQRLMNLQMRGEWKAANHHAGKIDRFLKIGDIIPAGALKIPTLSGTEGTVKEMRGRKAFLQGLGLLGCDVVEVDVNSIDFGKLAAR